MGLYGKTLLEKMQCSIENAAPGLSAKERGKKEKRSSHPWDSVECGVTEKMALMSDCDIWTEIWETKKEEDI